MKFSGGTAPHPRLFEAQVSLHGLCVTLVCTTNDSLLFYLRIFLIQSSYINKKYKYIRTLLISICAPLAIAVNDIVLS